MSVLLRIKHQQNMQAKSLESLEFPYQFITVRKYLLIANKI